VKTGHVVFRLLGKFTIKGGALVSHKDYLIQPDDFTIPFDSEQVHGISTALASARRGFIRRVFRNFKLL